MTVMKKKEFSDIFAVKYDMGKGETEKFLDDLFETFEEIILENKKGFKLGNLGELDVNLVEAKDHKRRNPQSGEEFMQHVPEHYGIKFKFAGGKSGVKTKLKDTK
ncbi:HU family DNA-binding protein [Lederbergia citrisecunda]|uniref:HU family DNA-binding protein n=1 Tax=Lederbergia citrisecunda TaxID=2833583 RepID=UPI003D2D3026